MQRLRQEAGTLWGRVSRQEKEGETRRIGGIRDRSDFFFFVSFFFSFQERQVEAAMQGSHWGEYGGKERKCVLLHVSLREA